MCDVAGAQWGGWVSPGQLGQRQYQPGGAGGGRGHQLHHAGPSQAEVRLRLLHGGGPGGGHRGDQQWHGAVQGIRWTIVMTGTLTGSCQPPTTPWSRHWAVGLLTVCFLCYICPVLVCLSLHCTEPGIRRENEDSRGYENRKPRKNIFYMEKKSTSILFFSMKMKMMDLWTQTEGVKLIFVMNFSALHFFSFASRMPQIAQILVSTFKIFREEGEGACPRTSLEVSSFFFMSNSRLCCNVLV